VLAAILIIPTPNKVQCTSTAHTVLNLSPATETALDQTTATTDIAKDPDFIGDLKHPVIGVLLLPCVAAITARIYNNSPNVSIISSSLSRILLGSTTSAASLCLVALLRE